MNEQITSILIDCGSTIYNLQHLNVDIVENTKHTHEISSAYEILLNHYYTTGTHILPWHF